MTTFGDVRSAVQGQSWGKAIGAIDGIMHEAEFRQVVGYARVMVPGEYLRLGLRWSCLKEPSKEGHIRHPIYEPEAQYILRYGQFAHQVNVGFHDEGIMRLWLAQWVLPFLHLWADDPDVRQLIDRLVAEWRKHGKEQATIADDFDEDLSAQWIKEPLPWQPSAIKFDVACGNMPYPIVDGIRAMLHPHQSGMGVDYALADSYDLFVLKHYWPEVAI